ncbi:MAG: hypothetical protein HC897_13535, partial [Thermoanaerobaculia bacterium]|nr:hypothetical protein [Thermoanaerobaculia bacterium]
MPIERSARSPTENRRKKNRRQRQHAIPDRGLERPFELAAQTQHRQAARDLKGARRERAHDQRDHHLVQPIPIGAGDDLAEDLAGQNRHQHPEQPAGQTHPENGREIVAPAAQGELHQIPRFERSLGERRVKHVRVAFETVGERFVDDQPFPSRRVEQLVTFGRARHERYRGLAPGAQTQQRSVVAAPPTLAQDHLAIANSRGGADRGQTAPGAGRRECGGRGWTM